MARQRPSARRSCLSAGTEPVTSSGTGRFRHPRCIKLPNLPLLSSIVSRFCEHSTLKYITRMCGRASMRGCASAGPLLRIRSDLSSPVPENTSALTSPASLYELSCSFAHAHTAQLSSLLHARCPRLASAPRQAAPHRRPSPHPLPCRRAFHLCWFGFFTSFVSTFAPAAMITVIREVLNLNADSIGNSGAPQSLIVNTCSAACTSQHDLT